MSTLWTWDDNPPPLMDAAKARGRDNKRIAAAAVKAHRGEMDDRAIAQRLRELAFIAKLKRGNKTDSAGNPSESLNTAHLDKVRQARNLLLDEVMR